MCVHTFTTGADTGAPALIHIFTLSSLVLGEATSAFTPKGSLSVDALAIGTFVRHGTLIYVLTQFSVLCHEQAVARETLAGVGAKSVHTVALSSAWVIQTFIDINASGLQSIEGVAWVTVTGVASLH